MAIEFNYAKLGARIRKKRRELGLSQEMLAEKASLTKAHISHIETGKTVPSLKTLINIINTLECSADELFCIEVEKAQPVFQNWLGELVADCSEQERKLIADTVQAMKDSMRRLKWETQ